MKVILAGYNVDTHILRGLGRSNNTERTPETLSAAYARVSRSPKSVTALRAEARREVERARRSNRTIIFRMGHHSVAEHAVFNFDILGISRRAVEELEKFRLASYTEKSQRYVSFRSEFVVPEEITSPPFQKEFVDTARRQLALYRRLLARVDNEDARFILPLAVKSQLGATFNARSLELVLRRFASHELAEVRALGRALYRAVQPVAPSIILFAGANDYDRETYPELRSAISKFHIRDSKPAGDARLVHHTPDGDSFTIAALLHAGSGKPFDNCLRAATNMDFERKKEIVKTALRRLELYDPVLREFEFAHLVFEVTISAAGFAQLKRHRLATLTCQPYDPSLGITLPDSVRDAGLAREFKNVIRRTEASFRRLERHAPAAACYLLTNSHRRRVLVGLNARELYHVSRLREDAEAQWDIRAVAREMSARAQQAMPLTFLLLGGKDRYPEIYQEVFGHPPKIIRAELPGARIFNKKNSPRRT